MSFWDGLFHRHQREKELDEEVQAHLRMSAQEHAEQGELPEQARASALREFGNVVLVKEVMRDMWGFRWFETLRQDLHYGLCQLMRSPASLLGLFSPRPSVSARTRRFSPLSARSS